MSSFNMQYDVYMQANVRRYEDDQKFAAKQMRKYKGEFTEIPDTSHEEANEKIRLRLEKQLNERAKNAD